MNWFPNHLIRPQYFILPIHNVIWSRLPTNDPFLVTKCFVSNRKVRTCFQVKVVCKSGLNMHCAIMWHTCCCAGGSAKILVAGSGSFFGLIGSIGVISNIGNVGTIHEEPAVSLDVLNANDTTSLISRSGDSDRITAYKIIRKAWQRSLSLKVLWDSTSDIFLVTSYIANTWSHLELVSTEPWSQAITSRYPAYGETYVSIKKLLTLSTDFLCRKHTIINFVFLSTACNK